MKKILKPALWGESRTVTVGGNSFQVPVKKKFRPVELLALSAMSRQRRSRFLRVLCGLCAQCGDESLADDSRSLGPVCLHAMRQRMRKHTGVKRPYTKD